MKQGYLFLFLVIFFKHVEAQTFFESAKLLASVPTMNSQFGSSVDIHEDFAIVGARFFNSAYIYERVGGVWTFKTKLNGVGSFGARVAIYDSIAVVSAPEWSSQTGAVYVYKRNAVNWIMSQQLIPSDLGVGDIFGAGIGVYDNTIVVGSPRQDNMGTNSGSIYIFEFNGTSWVETDQLYGSNIQPNEAFGFRVAIWDSVVVVGTPLCSYFENSGGAIHIFEKSAGVWSEVNMKAPFDIDPYDEFGYSVSISKDRIMVGSYHQDNAGPNSGSAYIFRKYTGPGWVQEVQLTPPGIHSNQWYGFSVSISDDYAVMGSNIGDFGEGVYVYHFNGSIWEEVQSLVGLDSEPSDLFGQDVSVFNGEIIVGAIADKDAGNQTGAAYIFRKEFLNIDERQQLICTVFPNPPNGSFKIQLKDYSTGTLEIYNTQMKLIERRFFSKSIDPIHINLLFPGIYYAIISVDYGTVVQKIVVQ